MNRIDWIVVRRLLGSIGLSIMVLFAIVLLVEGLDTTRFRTLQSAGGLVLAVAAIVAAAGRWVVDTLPLTVLVGAIAGLLNLQVSREMTVIKASGMSVWRVMKAPLAVTILAGLVVALGLDTAVTIANRNVAPLASGTAAEGRVWIDERRGELHYIVDAAYGSPSGDTLAEVTVFLMDTPRDRIEAPEAHLVAGEWVMPTATRYRSNELPQQLVDMRLPTTRTDADMRASMASVSDMTLWEVAQAQASRITDARERAEVETRFLRLIALPFTLCGSLVIAFAFTAGYRRTNKYGGAVLYGIVLGAMVYVVTELAGRTGSAGAMAPAIAVAGPIVVAIVIGVTVLLNREDGRT